MYIHTYVSYWAFYKSSCCVIHMQLYASIVKNMIRKYVDSCKRS